MYRKLYYMVLLTVYMFHNLDKDNLDKLGQNMG